MDDDLQAWAYQLELEQRQYEEEALKIQEMMPSKYLKKEDVGQGLLVTVRGLSRINVAMEGEIPEMKYVLQFYEVEKPLVLNSTNIQLCAQIFGSDETDLWLNKKVVLYTDPSVSFGGKIIGGIRVRAPRQQTSVGAVVTSPAPAPLPSLDDDIPF